MLFQLAAEVARFHSLDLLSVVIMGNHWHIVCAAPAEPPTREEVMANWRASRDACLLEPNWDDPEVVAKLAARMRDISCFVKEFEQRFTRWYNRTRSSRRRGGLWADRFRSVLLDKQNALWDCLAYVEMNPVRAGLAESPGDYRFCTWGRLVGSGTHPFAANLVRHLRHHLGDEAGAWSDARVVAELAANLARIAAAERGEDSAAIFAAETEARTGSDPFLLTVRRRVRYWSDGALIGSELFVREMAAKLIDTKRALRKRLAAGLSPATPGGPPTLFAYRRLPALD
jgi:REP element-mobilizing transposase RayT